MSFSNILEWSYWFHQPFIARGTAVWIWVCIFLVCVLAGLVLKIIGQRANEKYLKKPLIGFSNIGLAVGLTGLLWLFFRQETVPFLAWRFWLVIIIVPAVWRLVVHFIFVFKRAPQIRRERLEQAAKEKYLPGK